MAKILFATMPITGHVNPGLPIARQLVADGHEVKWYTGAKFKKAVEATGAGHIASSGALSFDDSDIDAAFPDRKKYKAMEQLKYDLKRIFTDHIPESAAELQEILKSFPASAIVVDTAFGTGPLLAQLGGPPCIAFGITAFPLPSDEVAPFGLGLLPDASVSGKIRNMFLIQMANKVLFKDVIECRNKVRAKFNLAPDQGGLFDGMIHGSKLYLQGTVPEFEYPRSNMPENVRFIGPLLPDAPSEITKPEWWDEMVNAQVPVIHVSQGTIATSIDDLILPAIYGLADMKALVIVSSKSLPESTKEQLPANVRLAEFLPYSELMQHVDIFITNGGYGGVHYALAQGVPIVVAGTTEDKPEVANRVEWSGAGINLRNSAPYPSDIRRAVRKIMKFNNYKEAAQKIAESIKKTDATREAATLIAEIANQGQPSVLTSASDSR